MSFNYEKHKSTDGHGSMWTSYSDLFLGLSIIFLLLYVTVSLRQSTDGIQSHIESQKVARENEDLKQQLKVYEALKQDYLEKSATKDDSASYQELMDQLDLLQSKADQEKNDLRKQALDHEKKERALNKYQQMVRNIINSNLVAKGRIKTRDQLIVNKDQQIETNQAEITNLEQTVGEKKAQLALGEQKIAGLNQSLDQKLKMLKNSYKTQKITQKNFEKQKKALEAETRAQVEALRVKNQNVAQQLNQVNQQLNQTATQLNQTATQLSQEKANVSKLGEEKSALLGKLEQEKEAYGSQVAKLQGDYNAQRAKEKSAFDAALAKEKLSGDAKAAREARFKADADAKARNLSGQIAQLNGKMKETEAALASAQENLNARKKLAAQIKGNFAAAGVKADVDLKTGDVLLSFGNNYFDSDRAVLKPEMVSILQKTIPAYSKSLFQDPKVAEKIQNVEIVGFASPTYKGKFIDPTSLDPKDKEAMNHNLDLSLSRAKSIFNAVFDQNKMTFDHQKRLLPLVKVTGRGFLANPAAARSVANESAKTFCEKNDCAKLQTVIIKFNLKD